MPLLADVAVPVPLSNAFTYAVPDALAPGLRPGSRVVCQFGKGRRVLGVVLQVADRPPPPGFELKPLAAVIARLHQIETQCGRPRYAPKWASRTMDLDVLMYDDLVEKTAEYTIPRPDLLKRPYMLGPMAEIAPDVVTPRRARRSVCCGGNSISTATR